jgi:hypothetical protein
MLQRVTRSIPALARRPCSPHDLGGIAKAATPAEMGMCETWELVRFLRIH